MMRLAIGLVSLAGLLVLPGCSLEFVECGANGVHCGGEASVCVCATGRCAEPDDRCPSGLHYTGGRCVPAELASSAVESTPVRPRSCSSDAVAEDGAGDVADDGGGG
ncbi:MAG: hypothetical protein HY905_05400 [Deltaproteobacteria bacterium]|nr:hypothetical protein [Deltaproteobacteria bacterium]